jgi:hypothetical protein
MGEALCLTKMLGTKSLRRPIPGWQSETRNFGHAFVGGVTTGQLAVTCLAKGSMGVSYGDLPQAVPRDASTVMASRPFVGVWTEAPVLGRWRHCVAKNWVPVRIHSIIVVDYCRECWIGL